MPSEANRGSTEELMMASRGLASSREQGQACLARNPINMLTREQAIADYDFLRGVVVPDRLTMKTHARYIEYADRMLEIYRCGAGMTRRELHQRATDVFAGEDDCPQKRIDAFCKLLDDAS